MKSKLCVFCVWRMGKFVAFLDFLKNLDHDIIRVYIDKRYLKSINDSPFHQKYCDHLKEEIIPYYDVKYFGGPFEDLPNLPHIIYEDREFLKNEPDFFFSRRDRQMKVHLIERRRIDYRKLLVHEIGYYPWDKTFHFGRGGVFAESELYRVTDNDLKDQPIYEDVIQEGVNDLKQDEKKDISMFNKPFVYVPLQTTDEYKRNAHSRYEQNNRKFVEFVDEIVPDNYTLLIKEHPGQPSKKHIRFDSLSTRCLNISGLNFSVNDLISKSEFVVAINTTSIVEAIAMGKKVFSYGDEIFCNKGLTHHKIYDKRRFRRAIESPLRNIKRNNINKKFISAVIDRSIKSHRTHDSSYVKNHFWNTELEVSERR